MKLLPPRFTCKKTVVEVVVKSNWRDDPHAIKISFRSRLRGAPWCGSTAAAKNARFKLRGLFLLLRLVQYSSAPRRSPPQSSSKLWKWSWDQRCCSSSAYCYRLPQCWSQRILVRRSTIMLRMLFFFKTSYSTLVGTARMPCRESSVERTCSVINSPTSVSRSLEKTQ